MDRRHPILSSPIRLHWAGWETDTQRLQQAGWQLSANERVEYDEFELAFKHEQAGCYGYSQSVPFRYLDMHDRTAALRSLSLDVQLTNRLHSQLHNVDFSHFNPIDAKAQYTEQPILNIEDYNIFAPALVTTKELVFDESSVSDLMEVILDKQDPARQKYYEDQVRERRTKGGVIVPQRNFQAQIISLVA